MARTRGRLIDQLVLTSRQRFADQVLRNSGFTVTAHSAQGDIYRSSLRGSGRLGEPWT